MEERTKELIDYFDNILIPRYEKKLGVSLDDAIFWNPLHEHEDVEGIESAIKSLEKAIILGKPLEDVQYFNPDVIY